MAKYMAGRMNNWVGNSDREIVGGRIERGNLSSPSQYPPCPNCHPMFLTVFSLFLGLHLSTLQLIKCGIFC